MSDAIIKVENLGKQYRIGGVRGDLLSERLGNGLRSLYRRFRGNFSPLTFDLSPDKDFWALRDVSFEVKPGEVVGIIGRNGAGKSTLLKILSKITSPTKGKVEMYGRVGSLLEVGTGFHPELTGRENIFLNGAILGMSKFEIRKKFDEIVAFAEVEKFIDTPVKHYSSGMYVRLAFAVAAHLEPEILIVDEVLAVGDAQFQKKCLGKMGDVAKEGRTVLFVSHNMGAVRQLCSCAILLNSGQITCQGDTTVVINSYVQNSQVAESIEDLSNQIQNQPLDAVFRLKKIEFLQGNLPVFSTVENGKPLSIVFTYTILERVTGFRLFFDLFDMENTFLIRSFHDEDSDSIPTIKPGEYISTAVIPSDILAPTRYELRIYSTIHNIRMIGQELIIRFNVEATGKYNRAYWGNSYGAKFAFHIPWHTESELETRGRNSHNA